MLACDLKAQGAPLPREVVWREPAPEGKLDLVVTLDFRMTSSTLYSDLVLPAATWYEREDLNTTDMHRYIHPFSEAVSPLWESRTDWDIFKSLAQRFSELAEPVLGTRHDLVVRPLLHDSPHELGQATGVQDWKRGECDAIPGKTMPTMKVVTRPFGETYRRFIALGPLTEEKGVKAKGVSWKSEEEVETLRKLNGVAREPWDGRRLPRLETARHAAQTILSLSPETNGQVSVKAWQAMSEKTGRSHAHLAAGQADTRFLFDDLVAQPRTCLASPVWTGLENEKVTYTGQYTNIHELIPWRTLSGRQELYQDHGWMQLFGESLCVYKPPIDTRSLEVRGGENQLVLTLNWLTPHQKWGIHSTFADTSQMLTLSRGGPTVWLSEEQARVAGIRDNDWIEVWNVNGAIVARAILSQRIPRDVAVMYHAQEKTVNVPLAPSTGQRGGLHNSVTRIVVNPVHMIGGYAQLSYFYNYYGTVGSNRDETVLVRKLDRIEWGGSGKSKIPLAP